jgi:hypothetical protein
MSATSLAAFACYGVVAVASMVVGAVYLFRPTFMPHHQDAAGKPWEELEPRLQVLILGLMRAAGGGFLGAGIAAAFLLAIPFRDGDAWSHFAIPGIGLATALPMLYATVLIRSRTGARTPVLPGAICVVLILAGVALSMI